MTPRYDKRRSDSYILRVGKFSDLAIEAVDSAVPRVTADGAYDTIAIYEAARARGATVVVPPTKTAAVSRRRPRA